MRDTITISLPQKMRKELDRLADEQGVSRSDLVRESLRDYLFVGEFRRLRGRMSRHAALRGVYTDEDVFKLIS